MLPLAVLDDEEEAETLPGAIRAHELGHLRAIEQFFAGVRAAIKVAEVVYLDF